MKAFYLRLFLFFIPALLFSCGKSEQCPKLSRTLVGSVEGNYAISSVLINNEEIPVTGRLLFQAVSQTEAVMGISFEERDGNRSVSMKLDTPMTIHGQPYDIYFEHRESSDFITWKGWFENTDILVKGQLSTTGKSLTRECGTPSFNGLIEITAKIPEGDLIIKIRDIYGR